MYRPERVLIHCDVAGDGMFPTEATIVIQTADGKTVTVLADKSLLSENCTRLTATRLSTQEDISICLLPTEDVETGSRWVRIRSQDLQFA